MNEGKKIFVGVRIPASVLSGIKKTIAKDPEEDLSSFIRKAIRRELTEKYLQPVFSKEMTNASK